VTVLWLDSYAANPRSFLIGVTILIVLIGIQINLGAQVRDYMRGIWRGMFLSETPYIKLLNMGVYRLRNNVMYRRCVDLTKRYVAPFLCAAVVVYLGVILTSHLSFSLADAAGRICRDSGPPDLVHLKERKTANSQFITTDLCWGSGLTLVEGYRYIISISVGLPPLRKLPAEWGTSNYRTDLGGFDIGGFPAWWSALAPMRRVWFKPWFRIIARIGPVGADEYYLDPDYPRILKLPRLEREIQARRTGELFLYVNDAVIGVPGFTRTFYQSNKGVASVTVQQPGQ
jgi:hypothetical protein